MKIRELYDNIVLYDVNTVKKFDILKPEFIRTTKINQDHNVMSGIHVSVYVDILRNQLVTGYDKFKLLATIDLDSYIITSYLAAFIVVNDTQKPACLIYGAYFARGTMKHILPYMLEYLDRWHGLEDTEFGTSRHGPAYERLLKNFNFKLSMYMFKRHIKRSEDVSFDNRQST